MFLDGGSEFTAIVLDVGSGSDRHPVVLLPTEVSFLFLSIQCLYFHCNDKMFVLMHNEYVLQNSNSTV